MKAIFKREFASYFHNMSGYAFCAFVLLFAGIFIYILNLREGYPYYEYVLSNMTFVYLMAIPVLTMRSFAEERKQKTDLLLYSLPQTGLKVVLGKYFSMLAVLLIPILIMAIAPPLLHLYGKINFLSAYGALFAFFLLGAALTAIGMFFSSLTENGMIAAIVSFAAFLINYFTSSIANNISAAAGTSLIIFTVLIILLALLTAYLTKNKTVAVAAGAVLEAVLLAVYFFASSKLEGAIGKLLTETSLFEIFNGFLYQIFDLTGILTLLLVMIVFVFLTIQSFEKRRWS